MKVHLILLWFSIVVSGCAHQPDIEPQSITTLNSTQRVGIQHQVSDRKDRFVSTLVTDTEHAKCDSKPIDLSDLPCNLLAWQSFLSTLLSMSDDSRQQHLVNLGTTDVDQLKRFLFLSHPNESLELRTQSIQELERTLSRYNLSLQDFLYLTIMFHKKLLEQEQRTEAAMASVSELQAELIKTEKLLSQAQSKIDAITNIEQQLNAEGASSNENDSEL